MSTDFRPTGIRTLVSAAKNDTAGLRAMRAGGGVTYALDRLVATETSLGTAFQIVDSSAVSAKVDRQNATPARYIGDSTNGTDGTAAFAVATLSLKSAHNAKPGADTDDAPGVAVRTYASGYALASGEVYKVYVGGVLKTVTTDYTVDGQNIVFVYTKAPRYIGPSVEIFVLSSATALTDEVVTVSVDGTIKTLTTHYTIGSGTVTFTAGNVPTTGQLISIWFRIPGTRAYTLASAAGADVRSVGAGVIKVYVATVLKTLTTDYTVNAGVVTFNADKIPADGAAVQFRWQYAQHDVFNAAGLTPIESGETAIVHKDAGVETLTTNYVITAGGKVTFQAGHYPAVGTVITIDYFTANAVVVAGGIVFFDTQRLSQVAWTHIVPTSAAIVEVM